jgi:hypothetical protein
MVRGKRGCAPGLPGHAGRGRGQRSKARSLVRRGPPVRDRLLVGTDRFGCWRRRVARRTARRGRLLRYCVRRARSTGTTASNAGAASTGRQALSGIQPTSSPDSAAPAEEPALWPLLTQFPARFRVFGGARLGRPAHHRKLIGRPSHQHNRAARADTDPPADTAPHDRGRSTTDEIGAVVRSNRATTDLDPPSGTPCLRTRARSDHDPNQEGTA